MLEAAQGRRGRMLFFPSGLRGRGKLRPYAFHRWLMICLFVGASVACNDATGPDNTPDPGIDLSLLFAAPTPSEEAQVLADWGSRSITAEGVEGLDLSVVPYGSQGIEVRVVSHRVGQAVHVGAIGAPVGAAPGTLPVLIYSHGGDQGVNLDLTLFLLPSLLGEEVDDFVFVVPSFRSESLVFDGVEYTSSGEPSPWDRDVDDALSLLEVALATTPAADPTRVGVLGFSRGATVGMLMAARDPRIDAVVEFFGTTDFFGPFVQEVVEEALGGNVRDLPGLTFLNEAYIQPLKTGAVSTDEVRLELLRRSPVFFAERLPDLQVHHGTDDEVVPVEEAERLIQVMVGLGRTGAEFEYFIYEGGGHDPLTLAGSLSYTQAFLRRLSQGP